MTSVDNNALYDAIQKDDIPLIEYLYTTNKISPMSVDFILTAVYFGSVECFIYGCGHLLGSLDMKDCCDIIHAMLQRNDIEQTCFFEALNEIFTFYIKEIVLLINLNEWSDEGLDKTLLYYADLYDEPSLLREFEQSIPQHIAIRRFRLENQYDLNEIEIFTQIPLKYLPLHFLFMSEDKYRLYHLPSLVEYFLHKKGYQKYTDPYTREILSVDYIYKVFKETFRLQKVYQCHSRCP